MASHETFEPQTPEVKTGKGPDTSSLQDAALANINEQIELYGGPKNISHIFCRSDGKHIVVPKGKGRSY